MTGTAGREPTGREPTSRDRFVRGAGLIGALGAASWVAAWFIGGLWYDAVDPRGFDQLRQAISETFAIGAPAGPKRLLDIALVVTGAAFLPFAVGLHRGLPRTTSRWLDLCLPWTMGFAGVATVLTVFAPCSPGCPGAATSTTDLLHAISAGLGYAALVIAPLFGARRLSGHHRWWARTSWLLGGYATLGFLVRIGGLDVLPGLQQRLFNTAVDVWCIAIGIRLLVRGPLRSRAAGVSPASTRPASQPSGQSS